MNARRLPFASSAFLALALELASIAGCYTGPALDPERPLAKGSTTEVNATETVSGSVSGIPCDVASLLAKSCASCHGTPLAGGAPNRMSTREDLAIASRSDPTRSIAELSVDRMRDTKKPMPPSGPAPESDIAVLEAWIAGGMSAGACETPEGTSSIYDTPAVCTSGTHWTSGDHGSALMRPGHACIACHAREREGPSYTIAGTVYPTAHEPDDCNGMAGAEVIITGADGKVTKLSVNSAGNFGGTNTIAMPYRAKVLKGGKTREMVTPQSDGDCNRCHSFQGTDDAKGRVMAP